jgi:peptidoglycan/LPS O-acetylase OafA/YrhL
MLLGLTGDTFIAGFPRVLFGYTVGIIIFRLSLDPPSVPAWLLALALPAIALCYTHALGPVLILAFPLILIGGLGTKLGAMEERIARWLGELSYPLYAVHYPIITLVMLLPLGKELALAAALTASTIAAAVLAKLISVLSSPLRGPALPNRSQPA